MFFHARLYFLGCLVFLGLSVTWPATAEVALEFVDTQLVTRASTTGVGTERFDSNTFDEFPGVLSLAEQRESATSDPEQKASASGQVLINCDYVATPELITASGFVGVIVSAAGTLCTLGRNS